MHCTKLRLPGRNDPRRPLRWLAVAAIALLLAGLLPAAAPANAQSVDAAAPAWLEPRGVNVADLVGSVPENVLKDMLVVYAPGLALAFYESGSRSGDTVTVRVRYTSKNNDRAVCLGKPGDWDTWPTVMPAGTLRLLANGNDVTRQVNTTYHYFAAGLNQPSANTNNRRYPESTGTLTFDGAGAIVLPANMGCWMTLPSNQGTLVGVFTFQLPQAINVQLLGEKSGAFRSYIGPGNAGKIDALRQQMTQRYGNRHDDIAISPPAGTEFVLVKFPPTPVDPYIDPTTPAGGTYRVRRPDGKLSVDHINSMALPLYGQWLDADFAPGQSFLPSFKEAKAISSPEYFVPTGIGYDACMSNGGCPASLLEAIYNAQMQMTVYFLKIDRTGAGSLTQIPLEQVGPAWSPGANPSAADAASAATGLAPAASTRQTFDFEVLLPFVSVVRPPAPDNAAGCPCGWFSADGRMLDYVAGG